MKRNSSLTRIVCLAFVAGLLSACGGGSGDEATTPSPTPTPTPTPTATPTPTPTPGPKLTLAATQVSVPASVYDLATPTRFVLLNIEDLAPGELVYLGGTYSNTGILSASFDLQGPTQSLVINFRSPSSLAPGTYTDVINVRACTENPCVNHISGSPKAITVTYTVSGVPGPNSTTVEYSSTSVTVSGDNQASNASFVDESIGVTITGQPAGGLWSHATATGIVVTDAAAVFPLTPTAQGTVKLTIRPPSTLGAGTYTDTVQVELCTTMQCTQIVRGSQATIAVTYTVTGSANPTVTVSWSQGQLTGADLVTTETRSPKLTLTLIPSSYTYAGIHARHTDSATGLITGVVETSYAHGWQTNATPGKYEVTLKPPATLGSGAFSDTMQFEACFDVACTNPVPNSTFNLSVQMVVLAASGADFTRQTLAVPGTRDVVWSATNQLLYAAASWNGEHRLVQLNPETMASVTGPAQAAQNLQHLAVTPDGSYLYAASASAAFAYRFPLPVLQPDLNVLLASATQSGSSFASDLQTLAGQPLSFVVALGTDSNDGVYVYDGSTARPNWVEKLPTQSFERPRWLVPAATPGTFISQRFGQSFPQVNTYDQLTVDAAGISTTASTPTGYQLFHPRPTRAGTKMYTNTGAILDATSGAILGQVPGLGSTVAYVTVADETRGRLYMWTTQNQREVIFVYDLASMEQLAAVPVYPDAASQIGTGLSRDMTLWGSNGLALVNGDQVIVFSGPVFVN